MQYIRWLSPNKDVAANSGIYTFDLVRPAPWLPFFPLACISCMGRRGRPGPCALALGALALAARPAPCFRGTHVQASDRLPPCALQVKDGDDSEVQARYTYVYKKVDGEWKVRSTGFLPATNGSTAGGTVGS